MESILHSTCDSQEPACSIVRCSAAIPLAVQPLFSSARLKAHPWACHAFARFCIALFTGDRNEIVPAS